MTLHDLQLTLSRRLLATIIVNALNNLDTMVAVPPLEEVEKACDGLTAPFDLSSSLGIIVDRICGTINVAIDDVDDAVLSEASEHLYTEGSPVYDAVMALSKSTSDCIATTYGYVTETLMCEAETIARIVNDLLMKNTLFNPTGTKMTRSFTVFDWGKLNDPVYANSVLSLAAGRTSVPLTGTPKMIWIDAVKNTVPSAVPAVDMGEGDAGVVSACFHTATEGEVDPTCISFFTSRAGAWYVVNTVMDSLVSARGIEDSLDRLSCLKAHATCLLTDKGSLEQLSVGGKSAIEACDLVIDLLMASIQVCRITRFGGTLFLYDIKTPENHLFVTNGDQSFVAKQLNITDEDVGDVVAYREHSGITIPLKGIETSQIGAEKDRAAAHRATALATRAQTDENNAKGIFSETLSGILLPRVRTFAETIKSPVPGGAITSSAGLVVQNLTNTPDDVVGAIAKLLGFVTGNKAVTIMVSQITCDDAVNTAPTTGLGIAMTRFISTLLIDSYQAA